MINLQCPICLYPKQYNAFWNDYRVSYIEGSTKSGKSVGGVLWIIDKAVSGKPNENYWCVSPVFAQAKILFRRAKSWLPNEFIIVNESELTIEIKDHGKIFFKSGKNSDSLYGEDVHAVLIDEASRLSEDVFTAIRSTTTKTRGQIRIVGNVKGRGNWFFKGSRKAQQALKDPKQKQYTYTKLTAADAIAAGVLEKEEIISAKRDLPKEAFLELYFCKATDDQGNPFNIKSIEQCTKSLSKKKPMYFGVDIGGTKSGDATVIVGLDDMGDVAFLHTMNEELPDVTEWLKTHFKTNRVKAFMDSTGLGLGVFQTLKRMYSFIEPFVYNNQNKQKLMEMLASAIRNKEIGFPEGIIKEELEMFEYEYRNQKVFYNAPYGYHDDHVNALALAWHCYVENRPRIRTTPPQKTMVINQKGGWDKLNNL